MLQNKRNILKLKEIRLDDQRISFQRACIERFDYEWVIEVINPAPSPSSEEDSFVTSISFIQEDGTQFDDVDIESFQLSSEDHENVYLFHMFPDEKQD